MVGLDPLGGVVKIADHLSRLPHHYKALKGLLVESRRKDIHILHIHPLMILLSLFSVASSTKASEVHHRICSMTPRTPGDCVINLLDRRIATLSASIGLPTTELSLDILGEKRPINLSAHIIEHRAAKGTQRLTPISKGMVLDLGIFFNKF